LGYLIADYIIIRYITLVFLARKTKKYCPSDLVPRDFLEDGLFRGCKTSG